jgi:hypothetical protein
VRLQRSYGSERLRKANQAPRCTHIKRHGGACRAPALRGRDLCHFHTHVINTADYDYQLPMPEDAASIQFGLAQVIRALQGKVYDTKTCALMIYALQVAAQNLSSFEEERLLEVEEKPIESGALVSLLLKRMGLDDPDDEVQEERASAVEQPEKKPVESEGDPSAALGMTIRKAGGG